MQVTYNKPAERGVTTLMYVGDDDAVDKAVADPSPKALLIGVVAAIVALQSKGVTRLAATGVAGYVGYQLYKSRK